MFQVMQEFEQDFCRARSLEGTRELNPSLQTFGDSLRTSRSSLGRPRR